MRRLILELDVDTVAEMKKSPSLRTIESMQVLTFLRSSPEEVALICRVKFKDPETKVADVLGDSFTEIQVLEKGSQGYVCYFKANRSPLEPKKDLLGPGIYLTPPYEISDGRLRASFLADAKEIRKILNRLSKGCVPYKVVSLMDAKFSPDSPLGHLTEKQRRVMSAAYKLGYYDLPRKVSSRELAAQLNISEPTLVRHRRKAEKRLLYSVLRQQ